MVLAPESAALRRHALACTLLLAGAAASASDVLSDRQCSAGVCMANVDATLAIAPCERANLVVAWAQAGGAMAIECWTQDGPMDQPVFVFDRRFANGPVYDLAGVRAFAPESLPQIANPHRDENDAMLPACQPPKPAAMAPGELLLTQKVPSDDGRHPYCYRILRVATRATGIAIRADDGHPPQPGTNAADWAALAAKMSALAAQSDAQARARVTRARAPLRDTPVLKAAPHGWLVAGDTVTVLDRTPVSGMVKVLHVGAKGLAIERWISKDDIAP
jgi:hypothetical protein